MASVPEPISRKEQYMSYLTGNTDYYPKNPITREEQYLFYLCQNGGIGGGVTPEQIQEAVDNYLTENPVSGMTDEQEQQLEQNTQDIDSLSEEIDKIIDDNYKELKNDNSVFSVFPGKTVGYKGNISSTDSPNQSVYQLIPDEDMYLYFYESNYAPTGEYLAVGANGTRYTNTASNLPTENSKLFIKAGNTLNIAIYSTSNFVCITNYKAGFVMTSDLNFGDSQIKEIEKIAKGLMTVKKPESIDNGLNIIMFSDKSKSKKAFSLRLVHAISEETNTNVWKLDGGYLYDYDDNNNVYSNSINIISGGEWACALKIKNSSDFMGGNYHGNEVIENCYIYVDDKKITENEFLNGNIECQEIKIIENTFLFNPDNQEEKSAYVNRIIFISKEKIKIYQKVKWLKDYTLDLSYLGMLCAMRNGVTNLGMSDTEYIEYDVSQANFDNPLALLNAECKTNRKMISLIGEEKNIYFSVQTTKINPDLEGRPTYVYNGTPYNKIYFSFCPDNYEVKENEIWEMENEYVISF